MNKIFSLGLLIFLLELSAIASHKILHISFHKGCIQELERVAKSLDWGLTSLYIHDLPRGDFDGKTHGNAIYNIGKERANNIWNRHKSYFNQFDIIITSDTAPLARIFLQNDYQGKLIIWVCNRFDYCDRGSLDCKFPDQDYYNLLRQAVNNPNVKFVVYNEFESFYASNKNVDIGTDCIKPCGFSWGDEGQSKQIKQDCFFIPPYVNNQNLNLLEICKKNDIEVESFHYNGPQAIRAFKGIINIPGAWSNLALFENLANGISYFVPSQKFMLYLLEHGAWMPDANFATDHLALSEWYNPELKDVLIYFDSWADLKNKIESTDFDLLKKRITDYANLHKKIMLGRWQSLLEKI